MKAPRQLATLAVAVIIALFAFEASGQQTPNLVIPPTYGMPNNLAIKNQAAIIEYDVTNYNTSMDMEVWYTNTSTWARSWRSKTGSIKMLTGCWR